MDQLSLKQFKRWTQEIKIHRFHQRPPGIGEAVTSIATVENPFRFPGQYYDPETGLHYNYYRYYDPPIGRYLTPDPIGLEGGINLFTYVQNDPVNSTDPRGLQAEQLLLRLTERAAPAVEKTIAAVLAAAASAVDINERTFVTYILTNPATGQVYVGRTSGFGDPCSIMMKRYYSHWQLRGSGFGPPTLDQQAQGWGNYPAIRGREQQLIDFYGGVGDPK